MNIYNLQKILVVLLLILLGGITSSFPTIASVVNQQTILSFNTILKQGVYANISTLTEKYIDPKSSVKIQLDVAKNAINTDLNKARIIILNILSKTSNPLPEALNLLSVIHARARYTGKTKKIEAMLSEIEIQDYSYLSKRFPSWLELLYRDASRRIALQRLTPVKFQLLDEAITKLKKIIDINQQNHNQIIQASAYHQLGRAYKHQADYWFITEQLSSRVKEKYQTAKKTFEKALNIDPNRIDSLGEIILIQEKTTDLKQIIATFHQHQKNIKKPHLKAKSLELEASLMLKAGNTKQAIKTFNAALALNPLLGTSVLQLSYIYQKQGKIIKALNVLKQLIKKAPRELKAHIRLGELYLAKKDYPQAITFYETALKIPSEKSIVYGMMPSRALYKNSLYYQAAASLSWLYLEQSHPNKALRMVQVANNYRSMDKYLMDTLASIYVAKKQYQKAESIYQQIIEKTAYEGASFHLAELYLKINKKTQAKIILQKLLASKTPFYNRKAAEKLARKLKLVPSS